MKVPAYLRKHVPSGEALLDLTLEYMLGADVDALAQDYGIGAVSIGLLFRRDEIKERERQKMRRFYKNNPERVKAANGNYFARALGAEGRGLTATQWAEIMKAWGGRCAYCRKAGRMTRDHIHPLSAGGTHNPANIAPACQPCNSAKKDRLDWKPGIVRTVTERACLITQAVLF